MKMKIIFGLLGFVSLVAASVANAATVNVTPVSQTVAAGDSILFTISGVDFADGVTGASLALTWDANVMSLDATDGLGLIPGLVFPFNDILNPTFSTGQVDFTVGTSFAAPNGAGAGGAAFDIMTISFTALAPPSSNLTLGVGTGGDWISPVGTYTGILFNGASVTVAAVPVPAAVWLFGSGLLGLVGVARRRQVA